MKSFVKGYVAYIEKRMDGMIKHNDIYVTREVEKLRTEMRSIIDTLLCDDCRDSDLIHETMAALTEIDGALCWIS